jgi:putative iron-dependent peroxidase
MHQPEILTPAPPLARFLTLGIGPGADLRRTVASLSDAPLEPGVTIGLGAPLVLALGRTIDGLRAFPALAGPGTSFPSTQGALWISLGGDDAGELLHGARRLLARLGPGFGIEEDVLAFRHGGRDLSGYEDGTENPKGERAAEVALVRGKGAGLDGSSFVAAQRWQHDLAALERMTSEERDLTIGRRRSDNEEIEDAPPSAHVKRTAQESFSPEAFMLRRSLPWGTVREHGLYFVAFGAALDAFERQLARMAGLEDGTADALLRFTRPLSGGSYWCPPLANGRLDLRALGSK